MDPEEKYDVYIKHHLSKECKVCRTDESHIWQFIFCDSCDDGYHWKCLDTPLNSQTVQAMKQWLCPSCLQIKNKIMHKARKMPKNCYKCGQNLKIYKKYVGVMITDEHGVQRFAMTPVPQPLSKICRHCRKYFHSKNCFSERPNCLNCKTCEKNIRSGSPKCHSQFVNYLKQDLKQIQKQGFIQIHDESTEEEKQQQYSYQRLPSIGLKLFQHCGDWETICRIQSSLYYALKSNNLHYTNNQLYENLQILNLNKPSANIHIPFSLSKSDQLVYKNFKHMTNVNLYIPAIEIKQDYVKGFYAVAAQYIPSLTLICQYVGQVRTKKQTIARHEDNDSVMSLIVTQFAESGLDIAPEKFSGVSKFISGVPENRKDMVNIRALNFCYKERSHIIFYTIKAIKSGETLYIDYNGGIFQQFPTQNFTV